MNLSVLDHRKRDVFCYFPNLDAFTVSVKVILYYLYPKNTPRLVFSSPFLP